VCSFEYFYRFNTETMGLPAKRRTKQSKRERASHFALATTSTIACSNCSRRIRTHRVCPHCGFYRGRQVLKVMGKVERRAAKKKALAKKAAPKSESKSAKTESKD
jgi:large subunit ribosomal protein L32